MHGAGVDPHQVAGALDEAVHGDVGAVQVLQDGPPRARQVVHAMPATQMGSHGATAVTAVTALPQALPSLVAEGGDGLPVVLVHREPLAVPGPDVDVDGAEVVVLLVAWGGHGTSGGVTPPQPARPPAPPAPRPRSPGVRLPGTFM